MDLKQFSLSDLKALAYDQLVLIEQGQQNLRLINAEIQARLNHLQPDAKEEE